jgi:hypothetical protein
MTNKDWLKPACKVWAEQKRALWPTIDGASSIVKLLRQKDAPLESFSEDGAAIQWATFAMEQRPRLVLHVHYLLRPTQGRAVSAACGISEAQYWHELDVAYAHMAGRLSTNAHPRPQGT